MRRLHLVVPVEDTTGPLGPKVAECLRAAGWEADYTGTILRKNGAVWASHNDGSSLLTCPNDSVVTFSDDVRAVVVAATCLAAAESV